MKNIFYGILAVGLLLFLSSNIYANPSTDCKPFVHIQPIKGNYIPLLNGDIENFEKFLLELAEQNPDYCKVSLRIDFKKGLEIKQTITRGESRYSEKIFLEVQYFSPSYEAIIKNAAGDVLHKVELGKELKSIEYSNPKSNNHDELYREWRRISDGDLYKIETDANNFQALIDFLKVENGMRVPAKKSLAVNEKKEILSPKGEVAEVENKEKSTWKSRRKSKKEAKSKTKAAKKESKEMAKIKTQSAPKNSVSKVEEEAKSKIKVKEEAIKESEKQQANPPSNNKERTPSKEESSAEVEKYSPPITSTELEEIKESQAQEPSKPREIISDDEMFGDAEVVEPLAEMVRFQFPYGKNYMVINESDFSIKINTGRESGKVFADNSIKPKQEKKLKNKFKNGDWYSIVYPEKLHKKDVENYRKSIKSILSDLALSDIEDDFFKMSEQLIPNLDIITNENPLSDKYQEDKVEVRFQKFIKEKGIEIFKENQQAEKESELKKLLTLIVQSHRLHQYYKYTVGDSAAKRPVNKLPRFRKK